MSASEQPKPILLASLLCDSILQEQDRTISAIRIVDQLTINIPTRESLSAEIQKSLPVNYEEGPAIAELKLLICLKAGDYRGKVVVAMRTISTTGKAGSVRQLGEAEFSEASAGLNVISHLRLLLKQTGLAWVEVLVNDELRSRIPLTVRLAEGSAPFGSVLTMEDACPEKLVSRDTWIVAADRPPCLR